ncbi:MAG TPA: hypothetical protein VG347_22495 [Verrucomicrobiae bacterium]|nr:hypothetical protein [Verrucomicrobiae bacterium]
MNADNSKPPRPKRRWFSIYRLFDWIESHEEETPKKVFTTLTTVTIGAIAGLIWANVGTIGHIFVWAWGFLQASFKVKLVSALVFAATLLDFAWLFHWIFSKDKKLKELEGEINKLKTQLNKELVTRSIAYFGGSMMIEAINNGTRPIILTEIVAIASNGGQRSQGLGEDFIDVKLEDQQRIILHDEDLKGTLAPADSEFLTVDLYFEDTLGNKHYVKDAKETLEKYYNKGI